MSGPVVGDLRVWWIPQVPMHAFHVPVSSPQTAKAMLDALARYDQFQYENDIKPDYSNAGGLEVYEADDGNGEPGWCEWYDQNTGACIDEWEAESERVTPRVEAV